MGGIPAVFQREDLNGSCTQWRRNSAMNSPVEYRMRYASSYFVMTPPDSREKWPTVTPLSAAAGQTVPKKFPPLHFFKFVNDFRFPGWGARPGLHDRGLEIGNGRVKKRKPE